MTQERHDILPRIIALLLGLALIAERAASRPLFERLWLLRFLFRAQCAALTLIDVPQNSPLSHTVQHTLECSDDGDSIATLYHLAIVLRAIAAVLMHACLTEGTPRACRANHAIALSLNLHAHSERRLPNQIGLVHDTS